MTPTSRLGLGAAFVCSGAAALVYQVVWMRELTLLFGATAYAVSTILACFMGGLALGGYVAGRRAARLRDPGRVYALLELLIAGWGALSPWVFEQLPGLVGLVVPRELTGLPDVGLRFAMAVPALLLPTALMGSTLPILAAVFRDDARAARLVGALYAANTLGASAGAALAGYVLVGTLGLRGASTIGVLLNLLAAGAAYAATRGSTGAAPAETAAARGDAVPLRWVTVAFSIGLVGLALEVLWTRTLVLYLGSSVYAYASMLTIYLLGLAGGGAVGVLLLDRSRSVGPVIAIALAGLAFDLPLLVHQLGNLSARLLQVQKLIGTGGFGAFAVAAFVGTLEILLLPTALMGIVFPLLLGISARGATGVPRRVGALYAASTVGSIAGAILAPLVLIPALGVQGAMTALSMVALLVGGLALASSHGPSTSAAATAGAVLLLLLVNAWAMPPGAVIRRAPIFSPAPEERRKVVAIDEDVDATISVEAVGDPKGSGGWYSLSVNGVNVAGTAPDLVAIQKMQGHLPMLLAAERRRVLHIGFGSGGTAHAVSQHPVEAIEIAELSLGVIRTSDRYLRAINHGVIEDPRVRVVHKDGRNYLLSRGAPFDVILSDSVHPRYSGNGALYTRDYYERCRSQLTPGGVVSQWLPMYSMTPSNFRAILQAFVEVFPDTSVWYVNSTVNPFTIVVGHTRPLAFDVADIAGRMAEKGVAADLVGCWVARPSDVLDYFLMGGEGVRAYTRGVAPHVDDLPVVEYESMLVVDRDATWRIILDQMLRFREPAVKYLAAGAPADVVAELERAFPATGRSLEGHVLAAGGKIAEARKVFEEARAMNPSDPDPRAR